MVGLGGASFPTHIKFNPKNIDDVHTLIVNGAECEPFITSDHRTMLEDTDDLISGMQLAMKYIGLDQGYIGIEENKPDAIAHLDKALADKGITNIKTFKLQARSLRELKEFSFTRLPARPWTRACCRPTWA